MTHEGFAANDAANDQAAPAMAGKQPGATPDTAPTPHPEPTLDLEPTSDYTGAPPDSPTRHRTRPAGPRADIGAQSRSA